ncbi:MAG: hypothetical protein ACRCV0_05560 [Brevinema sp.]
MNINISMLNVLMFFIVSTSYPILLKSKQYTVSTDNSPVYSSIMSTQSINTVPFGMPFRSLEQKAGRLKFIYQKKEVWIPLENVVPIDFNQFTTSSTLFVPSEITSNGNMWFIYKNQMYRFNVTNERVSFESISKMPNILDAVPSGDRTRWFLLGEVRTEDKSLLNIGLFSPQNKKFTELTTFFGENVTIESVEFSPDNNYLSLFVNRNDVDYIYIFDVNDLSLLMTDKNITGFTWSDDKLLIYYPKNIGVYQINPWQKIVTKGIDVINNPSGRLLDQELLVQNKNIVYLMSNNTFVPTKYKSLDRSPKGTFEHYQQQGQMNTFFKGQRIYSLSGAKPKWVFLSFIDHKYLLYKQQKDALTTLYRYDAEEKLSVPYYWIEEPYSIFDDGTLVDVAVEDKQIWIFIESPNQKPKMLKLHELL